MNTAKHQCRLSYLGGNTVLAHTAAGPININSARDLWNWVTKQQLPAEKAPKPKLREETVEEMMVRVGFKGTLEEFLATKRVSFPKHVPQVVEAPPEPKKLSLAELREMLMKKQA